MRSQSLFNFLTKESTQAAAPAAPAAAAPVVEAQVDEVKSTDNNVQSPSEDAAPARRLVRRDRNGRVTPSPTVFKGGYAVNTNDDNVDWTAQGDGSINIYGAKFTDDQYRAYNNVRSSLATAMRQQEGLGVTEAQQRATRLANQWAADRAQVAAGGRAMDRWRHVDNPSPDTNNQPAISGLPVNSETSSPATIAATPDLDPLTPSSPISISDSGPLTLRGINFNIPDNTIPAQQSPQVEAQTAPQPVQPAPAAAPAPVQGAPANAAVTSTESASQPKAEAAAKPEIAEASAHDFRTRALTNRNKVADGLAQVNGYTGIYYKPGDTSGTLYKNNGEPWRNNAGQVVNAEMLRQDTNWFGANGNDIKHNIEQRYQEDANKAFTEAEAALLGFKPVPGAPGYYINSKGEIVDEFGNAEDAGTLVSDVSPSVLDDIGKAWREWSPDPLGALWSGSREDYK